MWGVVAPVGVLTCVVVIVALASVVRIVDLSGFIQGGWTKPLPNILANSVGSGQEGNVAMNKV